MMPDPADVTILIADDLVENVRYLERVLALDGYTNVITTQDSRRVLPLVTAHQPDLILLDLRMPYLDGYAVLNQVRAALPPDAYLPILVLTADVTAEAKRLALAAGATDYLSKPFDPTEVLLRIRNLLETSALYGELRTQNGRLEAQVWARTRELELAQRELVERLAIAAKYRDDDTSEHAHRMGESCAWTARALGWSDRDIALIRQAAPLHDLGKIGVPDSILHKRTPLSDEERTTLQRHTVIGAAILTGAQSAVLQMAGTIALAHHEHWDGSGYPQGLTGAAIPQAARIVAVADRYDRLTHRAYGRPPRSPEMALAELQREAGRRLDPTIVAAFLAGLAAAAAA